MGLRSRRKGKTFELTVRDHIQHAFRHLDLLTVRRSSQAERAYESDLIIEGPDVPTQLAMLWVECEHANKPNPAKKFEQAVRDCSAFVARMRRPRIPIVCWRATRERTVWLTTTYHNLNMLLLDDPRAGPWHAASIAYEGAPFLVTTPLTDALAALACERSP